MSSSETAGDRAPRSSRVPPQTRDMLQPRAPLRRRDRLRLAGAAGLGVVLLLVAALGWVMTHRLAPSPSTSERTAVQAATRDAVQALLTFSPQESEAEKAAVQAHLAGRLAADYRISGPDAVMGGVAAAGATSTARVVGVGVADYGESTARVLVFIDQDLTLPASTDTRGGTPTDGSDEGSVKNPATPTVRWASMTRVDENWRLAGLSTVGGVAR